MPLSHYAQLLTLSLDVRPRGDVGAVAIASVELPEKVDEKLEDRS
jgi:hypothetical protein